jgi:hypothetical protein
MRSSRQSLGFGRRRRWRRLFSKNVDLAPDGKRVVAVMPAKGGETQQPQHHVVFLENFFDELRCRAPVKR